MMLRYACTCRFESEHSVVLRFIIGSSPNAADEAALQQEVQTHGDLMRLPLQVTAAASSCLGHAVHATQPCQDHPCAHLL
jgi:hypothetical protein